MSLFSKIKNVFNSSSIDIPDAQTIYFKNGEMSETVKPYQFSPVSNGSYYSVHVSSGTKKAVRRALQGQDTSQGALYFMERALADSGNASWFDRCLTKVKRHGCHEFYK